MSLSVVASKAAPTLVVVGAVSGVVAYVHRCLSYESSQMDRFFSSYNTPQSEANRAKVFQDASYDPRTNVLNVLGWKGKSS
ncbi:uncharacterized protein E0L32_008689 [Thyridium curvatum]|uniref:Uncharacterized protein n=1 Tax=Thyridium curvatum TaxID=1093900 RepID=A0A507AUW0_9PEZI|nr:uncharacterized protein E0L32_008689 [Thyridium curvatum]TPX10284.1 hypothetical protein E0L32_008689 [Thyridium curvatum]